VRIYNSEELREMAALRQKTLLQFRSSKEAEGPAGFTTKRSIRAFNEWSRLLEDPGADAGKVHHVLKIFPITACLNGLLLPNEKKAPAVACSGWMLGSYDAFERLSGRRKDEVGAVNFVGGAIPFIKNDITNSMQRAFFRKANNQQGGLLRTQHHEKTLETGCRAALYAELLKIVPVLKTFEAFYAQLEAKGDEDELVRLDDIAGIDLSTADVRCVSLQFATYRSSVRKTLTVVDLPMAEQTITNYAYQFNKKGENFGKWYGDLRPDSEEKKHIESLASGHVMDKSMCDKINKKIKDKVTNTRRLAKNKKSKTSEG